jgi:uncharacterized protein YrzB (UPF0473 family)
MRRESRQLKGKVTKFSSKLSGLVSLKRHTITAIVLYISLITLGTWLVIHGFNLYYNSNERIIIKPQSIYIEVGGTQCELSFETISLVIDFSYRDLPLIGLTLRFSVDFTENFWFIVSVPHRAISHDPEVIFVYNEETDRSSFEISFNVSEQSYFEKLYVFETEIRSLISYHQYQFSIPFIIDGAKDVREYVVMASCQENEAFIQQSLYPTTPHYFVSKVHWRITDLHAESLSSGSRREYFPLVLPTISATVENGQRASERDFMNFQSGLFIGIGTSVVIGILTDIVKATIDKLLRIR